MKNTPEREAKVSQVIAAGKGFTENHKEFLVNLECEQFGPIYNMATERPKGEVPEPKTLAEAVAAIPEQFRAVVNASIAMHDAKKAEVVGKIIACNANKFIKEQLEVKDVPELEAIAAFIPEVKANTDYSAGAGAGGAGGNKDVPVLEVPSLFPKK